MRSWIIESDNFQQKKYGNGNETEEKEEGESFFFFVHIGGWDPERGFHCQAYEDDRAFVVLIFIFIGNRYVCMQRLREIDRLQQQLRDVRFEALSISSELTGNSRQSQIELLIEEQGIELEAAKNPPYELYK